MKKQFATALIAAAFSISAPSAFAQPSLKDAQDMATVTTIIESHSDALFVRALSEECAGRYPAGATAWRKTKESYLAHFKDADTLIQAQYAKTLGLAVPKSEYEPKAAKALLQ